MSKIVNIGNMLVEIRSFMKKNSETGEWEKSEKQGLFITRFFGRNYAQLKIPLEEVPSLISALSELGLINGHNGKKEVK